MQFNQSEDKKLFSSYINWSYFLFWTKFVLVDHSGIFCSCLVMIMFCFFEFFLIRSNQVWWQACQKRVLNSDWSVISVWSTLPVCPWQTISDTCTRYQSTEIKTTSKCKIIYLFFFVQQLVIYLIFLIIQRKFPFTNNTHKPVAFVCLRGVNHA